MKFFAIIICAVVCGIGRGKKVVPESKTVTIFFIRHAQSIWNVKKALGKLKKKPEMPMSSPDDEKVQITDLWTENKFENNKADVPFKSRSWESCGWSRKASPRCPTRLAVARHQSSNLLTHVSRTL